MATAYQFGLILPLLESARYIAVEERDEFITKLCGEYLVPSEQAGLEKFREYYTTFWGARDEGRQPATEGEKPGWRFGKAVGAAIDGDPLAPLSLGIHILVFEGSTLIQVYEAFGDNEKAEELLQRHNAMVDDWNEEHRG